jgi:hypothetical protein
VKPTALKFYLEIGLAGFLFVALTGWAQHAPLGGVKDVHATDFTSESYFEPPDDTKVRMRLSGTQASPLPGGLLAVKNLKVETFAKDGKPEALVQAPECVYAPLDGVASSAGKLELQTGDGKFHIEGEGFLWRQNESSLTISNRVRTLVDLSGSRGFAL